MKMKKYFDTASIVIIILTLALFIAALFIKGFTHDLLLEAGVFLVSVKIIQMSYKNSVFINDLQEELREIKELIRHPEIKGD